VNLNKAKLAIKLAMPSHGPEIPYEKRITVVVLRLLCGFTFALIAEKLDLELRSVHHIYSRAIQRMDEGLRDSFLDVARNVKDAERSDRPAIIANGSPASMQLRQLFLEYFDLPIEVVTGYIAGIKMVCSTAEQIAREHRDPLCNKELVQVIQPIKSLISFDIQDLHIKYANWYTQKLDIDTVFIFVDKTYMHFGGQLYKKTKITKPKGADPTPYARHEPPEQFQFML
jgi:hypothetical protein